jgi:hypothetical protein
VTCATGQLSKKLDVDCNVLELSIRAFPKLSKMHALIPINQSIVQC